MSTGDHGVSTTGSEHRVRHRGRPPAQQPPRVEPPPGTMTPPAPWTLLVLLLLFLASLPAEGSDRDSPSCNEDPLTVSRGQPAVMSCAMSTPLSHVAIDLSAPGKASQLIFGEDGPGNFSNNGWQLEVRGGEARLVIPDAQPAQAGEYTWYLVGTHRSVGHTRLNVSEPVVTETVSTPPAATGTRPPPPAASTMSPILVLLAVIVLLVLTVIAVLAWRRRHRSQNLQKVPQVSESALSRLPLHDAEAEEADVPRVGPLSQDTDSFRLESEAPGGDSGGDSGPGLWDWKRTAARPSQQLPGPAGQRARAP